MKKFAVFLAFFAIFSIMSGIVHYDAMQVEAAGGYSEIVIEQSTGRVLYARDESSVKPMASTTKILTAITAIENYAGELNETVTVPDCAVGVEGSSMYLQRGERLLFIDLLYGLMLRSGNDCAVAVAVLTAGSVENFAEMMNRTALKAGAVRSHFVNPHGLHDDNHYTTAADLAAITGYAMKNDLFCEIVASRSYTTHRSRKDAEKTIYNKNKLLTSYEGACGVKTGYTLKAGRCLVSAATRDGMTVIAVTLNCRPMFEECARLMDYAFENYRMTELVPHGTIAYCAVNDKGGTAGLRADGSCLYPVKKDGSEQAGYIISGVRPLHGQVESGSENGKLDIYLCKRLIFSAKLVTI